jgi:hypothetical protein
MRLSLVLLQVHVIARRYAVLRVAAAFPTQPFLSLSANHLGANKRDEIGTDPMLSPSPKQPLPDEQPVQSTYVESITYAHPGPEGGITAHSALDPSLIDSLKDSVENLQTAMHTGEGRPLHESPSLDDDDKVCVGAFFIPSVRIGGRGLTLIDRNLMIRPMNRWSL